MKEERRSPRWPGILLGAACAVAALLGLLVLVGWFTESSKLVQAVDSAAPMQPNTAIGFLLCAGGSTLLALQRRRWAAACAAGALVLAVVTGLQYVLGVDFGVDRLLLEPHVAVKTSHPGRMAPNSALSFSLCAAALMLLSTSRRSKVACVFSSVLTSVTVSLALVAILGYSVDVESAYGWGTLTRMSLPAAVAFLLLGGSLFTYAWFSHDVSRTAVSRWLPLPVAIGAMTATFGVWRALVVLNNDLGKWLRTNFFEEKNFVDEFLPEIALVTGLVLALLLSLAAHLAQKAALRAYERQQALRALRNAHAELERRVERRTAEIARVNERLKKEIGSRQRLEKMLRQRAKLLADADRRKDEFLAMLGHELRNPLATLSMGLEVLPPDDPAVVGEMRDVLKERVGYIVRLVDDLLDVSRVTSGKIHLAMREVDVVEIVEAAVASVRQRMSDNGQQLSVSTPETPVLVRGDPVRLEQVVSNLLLNAAKYTQRGGAISINVQKVDRELVLGVKDNGIGIPPGLLERVFEPFAQARRSVRLDDGGLGVGLTLVQRLVELHGGSVEARSAGKGRGSEFVVRLPTIGSPGQERRRVVDPDLSPQAVRPRRILVVDDNRLLADMLGRLLTSWGHRVDVLYDGLSALKKALAEPPEVALLDLGLPRVDGYQMALRLRSETDRAICLVALSGYGQKEHRRKSRTAGFDYHLVKPVDLDVLRRVLANPVSRREAT